MCGVKKIISLIFLTLFWTLAIAQDKFVVVIDPGHGGKDGGAVRGVYKEKDINLGVALILGDLIEQNFDDVKVVYTRKKDVFVDLNKRADIANKAKANLFISIHTNSTSAKETNVSGADTYILGLAKSAENLEVAKRENSVILLEDDYSTKYEGFDPNSPESYIIFEFMSNKYMEQSLKFAEFVQREVKDIARRSDRGVRQAGFLVLRKTSMPSVLIELGFINNQAEAKFLSSRLGQRSMATAIYSGFKKHKHDFDKKRGTFSYSETGEVKKEDPAQTEVKAKVVDSSVSTQPKTVTRVEKKNDKVPVEKIVTETKKADTVPAKMQQTEIKKAESITQKKDRPANIPVVKIKKEEVEAETKTTSKPSEKKVDTTNRIVYKVQFLVTSGVLPNGSFQLKGLSPVSYYKDDDGSVKYTYGETTDYDEITRIQKEVRTKFSDAFVIKFKNGKRTK